MSTRITAVGAGLLCLLVVTGAAAGQAAAFTFTTTAGDAQAGGDVTVTLTFENTGSDSATAIINVTEIPDGWTIADRTDDGGTWNGDDRKWLYTIVDPDSSVSPTLTLSVPADANGTYNVSATGADGDRTLNSTATVTVGPDSDPTTETTTAAMGTTVSGDTATTETTESATSGGSGDGFGVAVTGLAVLCGSLLARRRL